MKNVIDLSGSWDFRFVNGKDMSENFIDTIVLPDTTSHAKKGSVNEESEVGCLTDTYRFEGEAAFRKFVTIAKAENGETAFLRLERTRITKLYVDGDFVGSRDSLCTSHSYDITKFCDGNKHEITVFVSNVGYKTRGGHMTSPDTQTNWLGITGKIEVMYFGRSYAKNVKISSDENTFFVNCDIVGSCDRVKVSAACKNSSAEVNAAVENGKVSCKLDMSDNPQKWSEFERNLYDIKIDTGDDVCKMKAGLKSFKANGDKFYINGRKTFLRGKHDGLIFPLTGYAPTDVESWVKVMETSKSYGINHYRFHTCCPPDAAFEAADIVGIYMEPELPFWGTIASTDDKECNIEEQEYLISEGKAILNEFGNHPSFCMMSMGNELWGSRERINEIMSELKSADSRPLYTEGSNTFQFMPDVVECDDFFCGVRLSRERLIRGSYAMCDAPLGHVQIAEPSTMKSYDDAIEGKLPASGDMKINDDGTISIQYGTGVKRVKASEITDGFFPKIPIVTHEIGQYETYPNFKEIEKYTGSIKAKNFEKFRERLRKKGLLSLADDYFRASGKLAMDCYKEELEAVLRSKLLAGCQILDIQDFSGQGTALVGVLDAFMDNKGIISDSEWREFCSETVILARFEKYVYEKGERFTARLEITDFSDKTLAGKTLRWSLGKNCGEFVIPQYENYCDVGTIETVVACDDFGKLTLLLSVDGTDVRNHYDLRVVRTVKSVSFDGCTVTDKLDDNAMKALSEGGKVLLINAPLKDNSIEGFYCQDFWCFPMFRTISESMGREVPVGTMGLLIDNNHPALNGFESEYYSTPQWWKAVMNSRSEIIDDNAEGKKVIVRTIDNFERNHNLALIYEYELNGGTVVVCNVDLQKIQDSPEGRALAQSLADYVRA